MVHSIPFPRIMYHNYVMFLVMQKLCKICAKTCKVGVLLHVGMGHDAHQTCAKEDLDPRKIQDPGRGILTNPRSWVGVLIQDPVDLGFVHIVFTGSCGCWILFLEKLDPGDPRFAPIKLIGSGGYSTIKGTNPALKKPSNIPEIYAKMFGRIH